MARPIGPYTVPSNPRYGQFQGQTFRSYSAFETARAHSRGYSSIKSAQEIEKLEYHRQLLSVHTTRNPRRRQADIDLNRAFERSRRAERRHESLYNRLSALAELNTVLSVKPGDKDKYKEAMMIHLASGYLKRDERVLATWSRDRLKRALDQFDSANGPDDDETVDDEEYDDDDE